MSFNTERPKSTKELMGELLKKRETRINNLKQLSENAKVSANMTHAQNVLESAQSEQKVDQDIADRIDAMKKKRSEKILTENAILKQHTLLEQAKATVMNKVIFEMVYDAYWLDDNLKQNTIQETYNTYQGIMNMVKECCKVSSASTKFISAVEETVSAICEKAVNRILTEAKETGESDIEFNLTTEEESELDTKLSELGRDDIVELVKDKVLTVVQDERESGKEKASILQELNDTKNDDEEISPEEDENSVEEGFISNLHYNLKTRKDYQRLVKSLDRMKSIDCAEFMISGHSAYRKKQYAKAIASYTKYKNALIQQKNAILSMKNEYPIDLIKDIVKDYDGEILTTESYIRESESKLSSAINPDGNIIVSESAAVGAIMSAAVLGLVIGCVALSVKNKLELKKALKLYELHCSPKIKMSELKPTLYELDGANRATDKELSGIKKLLSTNSKRAKIWKDSKGTEICVAILYTETNVSPGVTVSNGGASPSVNIETIKHYAYDVNPKYKKDALYLSAYMAFTDGFECKNTQAFVIDMKKAFKEEMKNTKVKFFGKSLESTSILEQISPDFIEYESACKLLEECGVCSAGAEATYECAITETNPENAISLFGEYNELLNHGKTSVLLAPSDVYSHRTKNVVSNAIAKQQALCTNNINFLRSELDKIQTQPTVDELASNLRTAKINRSINRTGAGTLFESMMIANTKKTMEAAVTEGIEVEKEDAMNAALIESILQYTVLETLNTLQLYQFTTSDINKIKSKNKLSVMQ